MRKSQPKPLAIGSWSDAYMHLGVGISLSTHILPIDKEYERLADKGIFQDVQPTRGDFRRAVLYASLSSLHQLRLASTQRERKKSVPTAANRVLEKLEQVRDAISEVLSYLDSQEGADFTDELMAVLNKARPEPIGSCSSIT